MASSRLVLFPGPGGIEAREEPLPPLPRGWVLVRVCYAALQPIDYGLAAYRRPWLAPGLEGVGRVLRRGVDAGVEEGVFVAQGGVSEGLPGFEVEGWLASVRAAASSSLAAAPGCEWSLAYSFSCGIGARAAGEASGEGLAVLGCGASGLAACLAALEAGVPCRLYCLSEWGMRAASRLGLQARRASGLGAGWGRGWTLYVSAAGAAALILAERSGASRTLLHPVYRVYPPPRLHGLVVLLEQGDWATGARLSRLLAREGVVRLAGPAEKLGSVEPGLLVVSFEAGGE